MEDDPPMNMIWNPSTDEPPSKEVVELAATYSFARVLDVGCGWGRNLAVFRNSADQLHGFDLDGSSVLKAREALSHGSASTKVWQADIREVDLGLACYDLVMCIGLLHFLGPDDRVDAYRKLRRCIRPEGFAIIVMFNQVTPIPLDLQDLMPDPPRDSTELREAFHDWLVHSWRSYTFEDEHEGGARRHLHSIDRLVVRAP